MGRALCMHGAGVFHEAQKLEQSEKKQLEIKQPHAPIHRSQMFSQRPGFENLTKTNPKRIKASLSFYLHQGRLRPHIECDVNGSPARPDKQTGQPGYTEGQATNCFYSLHVGK
eukprot:scaffold84266_cov17-Tisochrysis_lutea.AAC.1